MRIWYSTRCVPIVNLLQIIIVIQSEAAQLSYSLITIETRTPRLAATINEIKRLEHNFNVSVTELTIISFSQRVQQQMSKMLISGIIYKC